MRPQAGRRRLLIAYWLLAAAAALTPGELEARLAATDPHRQWRIQTVAPRPTAADLSKVAGGAVVTGLLPTKSGTKAYAVAIVGLPIAKLWSALNDETRHPGYTAVEYSELLAGRPCASGRRVLQYLPVPMLADRWWIGVLTKNSKIMSASGGAMRELAWQSSVDPAEVTTASGKKIIASAEPIGFTRGAWLLSALDERTTLVEYYLHSDPGGSIPAGMANMFATKGVRETISAVERFAKEGHPSCPIE
jgi:hypothetical protein